MPFRNHSSLPLFAQAASRNCVSQNSLRVGLNLVFAEMPTQPLEGVYPPLGVVSDYAALPATLPSGNKAQAQHQNQKAKAKPTRN